MLCFPGVVRLSLRSPRILLFGKLQGARRRAVCVLGPGHGQCPAPRPARAPRRGACVLESTPGEPASLRPRGAGLAAGLNAVDLISRARGAGTPPVSAPRVPRSRPGVCVPCGRGLASPAQSLGAREQLTRGKTARRAVQVEARVGRGSHRRSGKGPWKAPRARVSRHQGAARGPLGRENTQPTSY